VVLYGVPQTVQRADPGVSTPRKGEVAGAACADELVVDDVGGHPDKVKVAQPLADDLVAGGMGIRCVKPSRATVFPVLTWSWMAS